MSNANVAVRERPILFSGSMVKAILDGRKTQTRRVMKPQAWAYSNDVLGQPVIYPRSGPHDFGDPSFPVRCPYGQPGGLLWVRESWKVYGRERNGWEGGVAYRADMKTMPPRADVWPEIVRLGAQQRFGWRPSIHMPRWASRITLEVTGVRVERLQDITSADAQAEGVANGTTIALHGYEMVERFAELWDSINGERHPWESNPWVWVIEFARAASLEQPIPEVSAPRSEPLSP